MMMELFSLDIQEKRLRDNDTSSLQTTAHGIKTAHTTMVIAFSFRWFESLGICRCWVVCCISWKLRNGLSGLVKGLLSSIAAIVYATLPLMWKTLCLANRCNECHHGRVNAPSGKRRDGVSIV